ncbi:hypothetical protein Pcinc_024105 [Petrolisthes cinctipes]|uniref:Uncharacterized protein n=1 Tax=Petrolisthes cinctipes TaxID=88211 RepID=A0AAE1KEV9_PETCI|nr:hypothetical protein Pcinc_024105 [Petrolisthes cinctipes]
MLELGKSRQTDLATLFKGRTDGNVLFVVICRKTLHPLSVTWISSTVLVGKLVGEDRHHGQRVTGIDGSGYDNSL